MSYQPFALKYRPQRFRDLVGQEACATTLKNALKEGRTASAYLFTGSRGTGKTSSARILAKALNCPDAVDAEPCCVCEVCKAVAVGEDLDVLEIDGASNRGIDEIRRIRDNVAFRPARGRYKIYIIDEVHMLTAPAFNALLKTLEEPPSHVKFIFATTEFGQVPDTIVSRCQRHDFRRITTDDLVRRLAYVAGEEGIEAEEGVFEEIARRAEGGLRDTMSLLDQAVAFAGSKLALADLDLSLGGAEAERAGAILLAAGDGDCGALLRALDDAYAAGRDAEPLLEAALELLREATSAEARGLPPGVGGRRASIVDETRRRFDFDRLLFATRLLLNTAREIKLAGRGRLQLETALLKLARTRAVPPWREILDRLDGGAARAAPRKDSAAPARDARGDDAERRPKFSWTPKAPRPPRAETASDVAADPGDDRVLKAEAAPPAASPPPPERREPPRAASAGPAQRPAAAAPPRTPIAPSLEAARAAWEAAFRKLQTSNARLAAAADGAVPSAVAGATITIETPPGRKFQKTALEAADARSTVEKILSEILGGPVTVRYETGVASAGAENGPAKKRDVYADPDVRKVIDAFDGGVIHVQGDGAS